MRLLCVLAFMTVATPLAACGGGDAPKAGPPGSPDNPMVGKLTQETHAGPTSEADVSKDGKSEAPGYQKLLERQTKRPRSQFTPCNLVSQAQARAILGAPIQAPLEAPQGPTCIYRTRSGSSFVTVAVQSLDLARVKRQLRGQRRIAVSGRTAYCGVYGQPMLYAALADGRVLSIGARCKVARLFANRAVQQLGG
jgi:hypothetical protein